LPATTQPFAWYAMGDCKQRERQVSAFGCQQRIL
jgi:hypothetical protein